MLTRDILVRQDLLMDWSLLRPHARYTLLRSDLLYTNTIPVSTNPD